MSKRVIICLLDSVGIGHAPDAASFFNEEHPDTGADTFGHIVERCDPLLPTLWSLGLDNCHDLARGIEPQSAFKGRIASAIELSRGKDTTTGHFELMGCPLEQDWFYFPKTIPAFSQELMDRVVEVCDLPGLLGNAHASGTEIIERHGVEHARTGKPICYTSADSVFQIAAHEQHFGLERLYETCRAVRRLTDQMGLNLGRVIARPFVGETPETFTRTANRKDFALPPPGKTVLNLADEAGLTVTGIGKIQDIFASSGVANSVKAHGLEALADATLAQMAEQSEGIIFTNFVDFDTEYGHRRDVEGYAGALEYFDSRLAEIVADLREDDLLVITADHGNDPTWVGSDHTREQVPIILYGAQVTPASSGIRHGFADLGASIAAYLELDWAGAGRSML